LIRLMKGGVIMIVTNPHKYVNAAPTNLRLDKELKEILLKEAEKQSTTMSDLINRLIRDAYVKKGE